MGNKRERTREEEVKNISPNKSIQLFKLQFPNL